MVVEPVVTVFGHVLLEQLVLDFRRDFVLVARRRLQPLPAADRLLQFFLHIDVVAVPIRDRILPDAFDQLPPPLGPRFRMRLEGQLRAGQLDRAQHRLTDSPPAIALVDGYSSPGSQTVAAMYR